MGVKWGFYWLGSVCLTVPLLAVSPLGGVLISSDPFFLLLVHVFLLLLGFHRVLLCCHHFVTILVPSTNWVVFVGVLIGLLPGAPALRLCGLTNFVYFYF